MLVQGRALQAHGADGRYFRGFELGRKDVFLRDLRFAPAAGAVELGYHAFAVFEKHLVDPVFIGAQGREAPIPVQADRRQRVQHHIGCELFVRVGGRRGG
ncbi:hypothetical protein D3C79_895300 [compost metagenome]